jgi:CBS domain-containing protein
MVIDAIQFKDEKDVAVLPVVDNDTLLGIVSDRDCTRKVILKGKTSKETLVSDIMSAPNIYSKRRNYRVHADNDRKARVPSSCSGRDQVWRDSLNRRRARLVYLGTGGSHRQLGTLYHGRLPAVIPMRKI